MPSQFTCPFQKILGLQTNEKYERHFRFFWEDDLIIIFKNNYLHTDPKKHIYYLREGEVEWTNEGNVIFMDYLNVFSMDPGLSVLRVVAVGDFLTRVGGDPPGGFSNNPSQFKGSWPDCKPQIFNFYLCKVSIICPYTLDNFYSLFSFLLIIFKNSINNVGLKKAYFYSDYSLSPVQVALRVSGKIFINILDNNSKAISVN